MIRIVILVFILFSFCTTYSQKEISKKTSRPKVGLVLSGGGAKGYAYIGLLKVLHEVNMPIDYIGGSSIGAVVGAMYAIGYHPDTIERIVRNTDWDQMISNGLDRKYLAFEEKAFGEKSIFSVPIDSNRLSLGSSLMGSLNVDLFLNRVFSPVYGVDDFSQLEIPFLCMGTDLLTGEGILLESGSLPRAIRASMAIPGYFSPINYQGHYLIDGGVVNNYPAEQVKNKGVDIIIGGDVQAKSVTDINELNSITKILDHIIGYKRVDANVKGKELTDYYVRFEMDYSMMDFNEYDSIINIGYEVAKQHYAELKHLADSLNSYDQVELRELDVQILDTVFIDDVIVDGNEKLKKKIVKGYFDEHKKDVVTIDGIEESVRYLAGTKSFKDLNYKLYEESKETKLMLKFNKAGQGELSAAMNYNDNYKGNIKISVIFRNLWNTRIKVFTDLVLGQSPRLYSLFIINNGLIPGIGFEVDFYSFDLSTYADGDKNNNWDINNFSTSLFMPITGGNNRLFKLGLQYDYHMFDQDISLGEDSIHDGRFRHFGQVYASMNVDSRDRMRFATKGVNMEINAKYALPLEDVFTEEASNNFYAYMKYDRYYSVFKRFVFNPSFFVGYSYIERDKIQKYEYGLGGQGSFSYEDAIIPFTGLRFVEQFGNYSAVVRNHFRYMVYEKIYATAMVDFGFVENEFSDITIDNHLLGYGVKVSYDSFIGPISFSLMGSNKVKTMTYFFNIGFPLK